MTLTPRHLNYGGSALRVADPLWSDPLDPSYAAISGGRWNPPGSFGVLYLNLSYSVAHANLTRLYEELPYGPEDLIPSAAPLLIEVELPSEPYVDAHHHQGLKSLGLPASYPADDRGQLIPHATCQTIGQQLWDGGELGIVCPSAAPRAGGGRELAWFARPGRTRPTLNQTRPFQEWFYR